MKRTIILFCVICFLAGNLSAQKASLVVQTGHFKDITCIAFSKDSRMGASGGKDNALLIYDANTAMQMASYSHFGGHLKQVSFSSDSKKVMGLSDAPEEGSVYFAVFDITKNDSLYMLRTRDDERHRFDQFRVSYDEKLLVFRDYEEFYFYDFASGKFLYKIKLNGEPDLNEFWQFTHDNKKIICEDEKNGKLLIVDLAVKGVVKSIEGEFTHMGISSAEVGILSKDDRYYSRCRGPEKWYKYDIIAGSLAAETTPSNENYGSPSDCHVTGDGKVMMMNGLGQLIFFDRETGKKTKTLDFSNNGGDISALSEDGKKAILCVYNRGHDVHSKNTISDIIFIDLVSGRVIKRFSGTPMRPTRVTFSNNSKNIAIASNMSHKVWNLQTADGVRSLPEGTAFDESDLMTMKFSPDDQVLYTTDGEQPDLVNIPTNEMKIYSDHFYYNYRRDETGPSVKWVCPDNAFEKLIISNSVYEMSSGKFNCEFIEKDAPGSPRREFTPDGKYAVLFSHNTAGGKGVRVYVYNTSDCKKVADYIIPVENDNEYNDYDDSHHAFSRDSRRVAIINKDYTLFDLLTGKTIVHKKIYRKKNGGFWDDCSPHGSSFSNDDSRIAIANSNNEIAIIETSTGKLLQMLKGHLDGVNSVNYSPDGKLLASSGEDGRVMLWDPEKGKQVATFIGLDSADYIVTTPDNYYMSTKKGLKGVGFRVGNNMFPVEQFDLRQNRPDTVLQRIGVASNFLLKMYRMAWLKRLKKAGFTPSMLSSDFHVPDIEITGKADLPFSTADSKIKIKVNMHDSLHALEKYNVYVNNVPMFGSKGFSLKNMNLKEYLAEINIDLNTGPNNITVSVFNSKGAESAREILDVYCDRATTKPDLYVLVIGVSEYSDAGHNLKFAAKDAGDFANAFKTSTKLFASVKTKMILNKDATLANVSSLKSFFAGSKPDDEVIVYFSGHGLLDQKLDYYLALHNVQFNEPSKGGLPYDLLESFIDSVPSRNRLVFIDACHSGEVDKEDLMIDVKANTQVVANARSGNISVKPKAGLKNSFDYMNMLFSDIQRGSGASVISAAGGLEFALESQNWNNGVFTYSILNGIKNNKADYNKDGKVKISELKQYVSKTVFELTNGKQNPTMRKENAGNDFIISEQ